MAAVSAGAIEVLTVLLSDGIDAGARHQSARCIAAMAKDRDKDRWKDAGGDTQAFHLTSSLI